MCFRMDQDKEFQLNLSHLFIKYINFENLGMWDFGYLNVYQMAVVYLCEFTYVLRYN